MPNEQEEDSLKEMHTILIRRGLFYIALPKSRTGQVLGGWIRAGSNGNYKGAS